MPDHAGAAQADPAPAGQEDDGERLLFAPLTQDEVRNCAFSSWYPRLRRATFESSIIKPLERDFVDYLLADGLYVPDAAAKVYHGEIETHGSSGSEWSDSEDGSGEDCDDGQRAASAPGVGRTTADIRRRIEAMGGLVFPRMGWSAPTDASWAATTRTLKCREPADVCSLLKSSDKIARDLTTGRYGLPPDGTEPELVLRRWANLIPSMMFRCFVKGRRLRAISQVDYHHHAYLDEMRDEITARVTQLFDTHVAPAIASESYCFDAYLAQSRDKTYVLDVEPWTPTVDSCLFEWRELAAAGDAFLGLRLFPAALNGMAHFSAKHLTNRYPVELTSEASHGTISALIDRMREEIE
ncbi:hypothetical protein H4R19_002258 [Coemansia spiralis]|nr:hypothetical protein H4R19_002258 [Coemansia spiralis]